MRWIFALRNSRWQKREQAEKSLLRFANILCVEYKKQAERTFAQKAKRFFYALKHVALNKNSFGEKWKKYDKISFSNATNKRVKRKEKTVAPLAKKEKVG